MASFTWVVNTVVSIGVQALNIVQAFLNRLVGIGDLILSVFGILPMKKIRIHVAILQDQNGPMADQQQVEAAVQAARTIFEREARTEIVPASGGLVGTQPGLAPEAALEVNCGVGAWLDELRDAGAYFRPREARNLTGSLFGYAAPVTAFVVRTLEGKEGCSLWLLTNYITIERAWQQRSEDDVAGTPPEAFYSINARTLAHEIAHACGLWHPMSGDDDNLMNPGGAATTLTWSQKRLFRNSRHVTYL